jgi:hypothetical protein
MAKKKAAPTAKYLQAKRQKPRAKGAEQTGDLRTYTIRDYRL